MTDKEARRILLDIADQMPSDECADWIDAISFGVKAIDAQSMRDATEEERKSVKDYIESISKPTGVRFDAQLTDAKETAIKSVLKYLVKMQIEEGSVGFAVDNDPDNDCCWDDALAWLEAQPCEDCISRAEVQDLIATWLSDYLSDETREALETIDGKVGDMPSVTPQTVTEFADKCKECGKIQNKMVELAIEETKRPKGKWMECGGDEPWLKGYCCSLCNFTTTQKYDYCTCGAEMSGGGDDADSD